MSLPNLKKIRAEEAAALALLIEVEIARARRRLLVKYDARSIERIFDDVQRSLERGLRMGITNTVLRVRGMIDEAVARQNKDSFPYLLPPADTHAKEILGASLLTFMSMRNWLLRAKETLHRLILLDEKSAGITLLEGRPALSKQLPKSDMTDVRALTKRVRGLGTSAVVNTAHTAHRDALVAAPQVLAVRWRLNSVRGQPKYRPDECNILATQDFYGLGGGVYPANKVPNLPHLNDRCWLQSVTRAFSKFGEPKPSPDLLLMFPTTEGVESLGPGMQMRARRRAMRVVLAAHTG